MTTRHAFHLVVTCVGKKVKSVEKVKLKAKVTGDTIHPSYRGWVEQLTAATVRHPAKDIYAGATWEAAKSAFAQIDRNKFNPYLWVASCGYGLIPATAEITSYGLTFKGGEEDSLCSDEITRCEHKALAALWWDKLIMDPPLRLQTPSSLRGLISSMAPHDCLLMAAGEEYYQAVAADLSQADMEKVSQQCVFIGKSCAFDEGRFLDEFKQKLKTWPPKRDAHGRLLAALKKEYGGCSATQILNRSAQYLIKHYYNMGSSIGGLPTD